jgi:hypothetical protein
VISMLCMAVSKDISVELDFLSHENLLSKMYKLLSKHKTVKYDKRKLRIFVSKRTLKQSWVMSGTISQARVSR